jgi:hypothetical protein
MTSQPATPSQGRSSKRFGKRIAVVMLGALALAGVAGSPAAGQPLGVNTRLPVRVIDPCAGAQITTFAPMLPTIVLGTNTSLNRSVQVPSGCAFSLVVVARPQIDLSSMDPDWNDGGWQGITRLAAQPQGSLPVQPAYNTRYRLYLTTSESNSTQVSLHTDVAVSLPLVNPKCFPDTVGVE